MPERIEFQWGWAAFAFLLGLSSLTTMQPAVVQQLLPAWFVPAWAAGMLASGVLEAAGTVHSWRWSRPGQYLGLHVEMGSLIMQLAGAGVWAWAAVFVWTHYPLHDADRPPFPVLSLTLVAVWAAINTTRICRLMSTIKGWERDAAPPSDGEAA